MNALCRPIVVAFVGALLWAACGSDSNNGGTSDDPVALCKQGCDKGIELCYADAGDPGSLRTICNNACVPKTCTNTDKIVTAAKECLNRTTCDDFKKCGMAVPDCMGGGGTGGAGGSGGSGGSDAGATCADLLACCNAASESNKANCMTAYDMAKASGDAVCAIALGAAKSVYCP